MLIRSGGSCVLMGTRVPGGEALSTVVPSTRPPIPRNDVALYPSAAVDFMAFFYGFFLGPLQE